MSRVTTVAVVLAFTAACYVKPVTKEDRRAVSKAMAARTTGTVASDRELEMADQDETMVCRDEMTTGSHIATRKCRTRRQLAEEENAIQNRTGNRSCTDPSSPACQGK